MKAPNNVNQNFAMHKAVNAGSLWFTRKMKKKIIGLKKLKTYQLILIRDRRKKQPVKLISKEHTISCNLTGFSNGIF